MPAYGSAANPIDLTAQTSLNPLSHGQSKSTLFGAIEALGRFGGLIRGQVYGLTGLGDLMATCMSPLSRNRQVGEKYAQGMKTAEIVASMNMVAEGIKTSKVVWELARGFDCEMPIVEQVYLACHEGRSASEALSMLIGRCLAKDPANRPPGARAVQFDLISAPSRRHTSSAPRGGESRERPFVDSRGVTCPSPSKTLPRKR